MPTQDSLKCTLEKPILQILMCLLLTLPIFISRPKDYALDDETDYYFAK